MSVTTTVESSGSVGVICVDRRQVRNAYDTDTLKELVRIIRDGPRTGVRVLVLTAAGEASFSSGMDLTALGNADTTEIADAVAGFRAAFADPRRLPIIAAVNGPATGGGFETVLSCDMAVAADHATFGLPEVRRGLVPGGGATLLPARIPIAVAQELLLLGEPITAARAYELGLVNAVVPKEQVLERAIMTARRVAENGPRAVLLTRSLLWTTFNHGAAAGWSATLESLSDPSLRDEMAEGMASFREKRSPVW